MFLLLVAMPAFAWDTLGPNGVPTGKQTVASARFPGGAIPQGKVITDPGALASVAADTLAFLRARRGVDPAATAGIFAELGVTEERMEATLQLVVTTAREAPERLSDAAWLRSAFDVYSFSPDPADPNVAGFSLQPGQIWLSHYLTAQPGGSATADAVHSQALYADPGEPWRSRYTRRQVMEGAYANGEGKGAARPLVWLTERDVHDAIMQGSAEVLLPDGSRHIYGVAVNNGIPWDRSKKGRDQDRYWYFVERPQGPRGYGPQDSPDIALKAGVTVAGDVFNLGLGRLILIEYPEAGSTSLRLAIEADTGGAFQPNFCELDWYTGAFPTHDAAKAARAGIPEHVRASVLVAKDSGKRD